MNAVNDPTQQARQAMQTVLDAQKKSFIAEGAVSVEVRIERLERCIKQVLKYQDKLVAALSEDFGARSVQHSKMMDVAAAVGPLQHAKKHVKKWMKAEKRSTMFPLNLLGARSRIEYNPLGVIGIISPWNFPVNLTFGPLANALAAGNRAMIKPSEFSPATSEVMKQLIEEEFDSSEIAVFTGGPEVGQAFSSLAFDHLIFTGATSIARHVMAAAAQNLVPLTLELGGKSPVMIGRTADLKQAADRVMFGKTSNAGQICLAPDYVLVAEEKLDELVENLTASTKMMFSNLLDNPDYTSIINDRHFERLQSYIKDAEEKGGKVIQLNPANESFEGQAHHKIPPTLIVDATDDMKVLQEEIFGPLLPIKTYKNYDEAIAYVNAQERPLALYYFGEDAIEERHTLDHTISGGVTLNDVIMHVAQEDLPFGGVGPSGMGSYHGFDGFKTFSHARAIFKQTKKDVAGMIGFRPPFGEKTEKTIKGMIK
jgi:coniferyl-aldehyde dehydrogenase